MSDLSVNANKFIDESMIFFALDGGEHTMPLSCSSHLLWLKDRLFACRFLSDCIDCGIEHHQNWLEEHTAEIAKKIDPSEGPKIKDDFEEIIQNRELISILSYEFFINYLAMVIKETLYKNTNTLKNIKGVRYDGHELINILSSDKNIILDNLANLIIFEDKQEGNLKTKPDFWIDILENTLKIQLSGTTKSFWAVFHYRRNASSHTKAKEHWDKICGDLSNTDSVVWLYSLMFLAYTIDDCLCKEYNLESNEIQFNFSGEPLYNLRKMAQSQCM